MRKKFLGTVVLGGVAILTLIYLTERNVRKEVVRAEEDEDFDNDFEEDLDMIDDEIAEDFDRDLSVDEMVENYQTLHCKER